MATNRNQKRVKRIVNQRKVNKRSQIDNPLSIQNKKRTKKGLEEEVL